MAPPPPRLPRLPEGGAGAGAGRGVAVPGARAGGKLSRLAAGPTPPRPPGLRHPPSPGFCEVALTWRSLRGGRSAGSGVRHCVVAAGPAESAPGSAKAYGALVCPSPRPSGSRPFAGPVRGSPALAGITEEPRGRKRPSPTRRQWAPGARA
ncbi:circumsporozoite protein-like [Prionailurus viverrinus]|uniref:circumsporozoite protein-like n=1 Tax=Prionailurus viverrinus TaxID=61388 RepID=UPI001FF3F0F9|nr:circumsporozoite protein-like [Prionailurus viverrinus]